MPIDLCEVTTLKQLRAFIRFPRTLYRDNPYWVPALFMDEYNTLRDDKNPAFEHCCARYWQAYRQGRAVGRVAAILNRQHCEKWGQPYLRFGWLDFVDDLDVASALLATVENYARENGLTAVHGPLGFTDLDREGMLVEGFNEMGTLSTLYNYPYYPRHLEALGYIKDIDWVEYQIIVPSEPNPTIARIAQVALRRNCLHLLQARHKRELLPYTKEIFHLLDDAYQHLYGVVPLTPRQVEVYIDQYFGFITPDFVPIVLDENGHMVAFGIAMPSLSRALQRSGGELFPLGFVHLMHALKFNDRGDLYLVAVRQEYQGKGVNAILIDQMNRNFIKLGIRRVESNPELETNQLVRSQWKYFETHQHKRRRCYIKHLEGAATTSS
ncbi:MAG: GNAT family N-acetyltransferase [Anaerolineae bacterium]|nr:GNAT family N-acetyltransferase [Anaerolineae bacterium]